MIALCSVKAKGRCGENLSLERWSQIVTPSSFSFGVSWNRKSEGNRWIFLLTGGFNFLVLPPYILARKVKA